MQELNIDELKKSMELRSKAILLGLLRTKALRLHIKISNLVSMSHIKKRQIELEEIKAKISTLENDEELTKWIKGE